MPIEMTDSAQVKSCSVSPIVHVGLEEGEGKEEGAVRAMLGGIARRLVQLSVRQKG